MRFNSIKIGIGKKVALGYGAVVFLAIASGIFSIYTLNSSQEIDSQLTEVYDPVTQDVKELQKIIGDSRKLISSWIYSPSQAGKEELQQIHTEVAPALLAKLNTDAMRDDRLLPVDSIAAVKVLFEQSLEDQSGIMAQLQSATDYDDALLVFPLIELLDNKMAADFEAMEQTTLSILTLLAENRSKMILSKSRSFNRLRAVLIGTTLLAVIVGIMSTWLSDRTIVKPINRMNDVIARLAQGELPEVARSATRDEVGEMWNGVRKLISSLQKTSLFAAEIGKGNLEAHHEKLSDKDILGQSLLLMRDNLQQVMSEMDYAVGKALNDGDLRARVGEDQKEGAWQKLAGSINLLFASISKPLIKLGEVIAALADGDLTSQYAGESKGQVKEVTDAVNSALSNLNNLIHQILDASGAVEAASEVMILNAVELDSTTNEIAQSISEMSNGAQTQLSKVDESSTLLEKLLSKARETGLKSKTINAAATKGSEDSSKGNEMLKEVVEAIQSISEFSKETGTSMGALQDRSKEIAQVLSTISEIASQTNLLSLNAAIEAAQAGELGRGFAVVAEEIRKLAEESREAAKRIEQLISDVQTDINNTADNLGTMQRSVDRGVAASENASASFQEMAASSQQTLHQSQEIMRSAEEQVSDLENVVSLTEAVVVVAEETATGTEQAAASSTEFATGMANYRKKSEELKEVALKLKKEVEAFTLRGKES